MKRGNTDAADMEAICEAVTRPVMRFVAVKSKEHQAALTLHKNRDLLVRLRTMLINAVRAHLGEYGIVKAQGPAGVNSLLALVIEAQDAVPVNARSGPAEHRGSVPCVGARDRAPREADPRLASPRRGQPAACHRSWHRANHGISHCGDTTRCLGLPIRPPVRGLVGSDTTTAQFRRQGMTRLHHQTG